MKCPTTTTIKSSLNKKKVASCAILVLLLLIVFVLFFWINSGKESACPGRPSSSSIKTANQNRLLFYVDVRNGNDAWKGNISKPNGNKNGPFKTLSGAIKGVRSHRRSGSDKATIYLFGGTHYVTKTIGISSQDSNLTIVGYPDDERPVISGAEKISGRSFTRHDGNIWVAPIEGGCSKHVFLGNKRMIRARKPNLKSWKGNEFTGEGPYLIIKDLLYPTSECSRNGSGGFRQNKCPKENTKGFVFGGKDASREWLQFQKGNLAEILVFGAWTAERAVISKITNDRVMFREALKVPIGQHPAPSGWRYIAENIRSELDAVGEYFCDEIQKMIYVIPPNGALRSEDVYISQTSTFFTLRDAEQVNFVDLEFRHSHDDNFEGFTLRPALLDFVRCDGVKIHRCKFQHIGHIAVTLQDVINAEVLENKFEDIGYMGITSIFNNRNRAFPNRNILIEKNTLRGCGITNMFQPACMLIQGSAEIRIRANDVSWTPYAGIRVGWQPTFNTTYMPKGKSVFYIERNHVHHYGNGILNDFAGIYLSTNTLCGQTERSLYECNLFATISQNVIHDSKGFQYGGMGVYGDTGSSSLTVANNWIYKLSDTGINFHCGENNQATNNMIYHTNNERVFGTCKSIGPRSIPKQTLSLTRNVIYVAGPKARMFGHNDRWTNEAPNVNNNVYYFKEISERYFDRFFPKYRSWEDWRNETGSDKNSVISNPQFLSIENDDYRLSDGSPALHRGIQSVDLRNVIKESGTCYE